MTSGIYRRLDFEINIPDESVDGPCQCVSPKEVVDSGPSRKRKKISDFSTSEEESVKSVRRSPRIAVKALKGLLEKKQKKSKEIISRAVSSGTQGLERSADIKKAGGRSLPTRRFAAL